MRGGKGKERENVDRGGGGGQVPGTEPSNRYLFPRSLRCGIITITIPYTILLVDRGQGEKRRKGSRERRDKIDVRFGSQAPPP